MGNSASSVCRNESATQHGRIDSRKCSSADRGAYQLDVCAEWDWLRRQVGHPHLPVGANSLVGGLLLCERRIPF